MSALPPSLVEYVAFCEKMNCVDNAFPRKGSFCESQMIRSAYELSDNGRYKMRMLFVGDSASALPAYFASLGHEVWLIDPLIERSNFNLQLALLSKVRFVVIGDSFLRWSPEEYGGFKMVCFVDSLSSLCFSRRGDVMQDAADTIAMAKARALKAASGIVFFTAEVIDPMKQMQHLVQNSKRYYTPQDLKDKIFHIVDQVCSHTRDEVSLHQSWMVR